MSEALVQLEHAGAIAVVTFNDPDRRNALGDAMFDALEAALEAVASSDAHVMLLRGAGPAFSAGFDMGVCAEDPTAAGRFIQRLGGITRGLRRMEAIVVAAIHGPAIAGGCAIVSACDLSVVAPSAKLGYPVHPIGLSPAVTLPTLRQKLGDGGARMVTTGGRLVDGAEAVRLGLASRLAESDHTVDAEARALCDDLASKGREALLVTKRWLGELDGSFDDAPFDGPRNDSAEAAGGETAQALMAAFWSKRRS